MRIHTDSTATSSTFFVLLLVSSACLSASQNIHGASGPPGLSSRLPKNPNGTGTDWHGCDHDASQFRRVLLEASLSGKPQDKQVVHDMLRQTKCEPIRKLARVLLEEWSWPAGDPRLQQPLAVWYPHPSPQDLPLDHPQSPYPVILVEGTVAPDGTFRNLKLVASTGNEQLDGLVLEAASEALFRPAKHDNAYAAHRLRISFHWPL